MTFDEDDSEGFERFVQWLYVADDCGELYLDTSMPLIGRLRKLVQLYILADKYDVPELKIHICDVIIGIRNYNNKPWYPSLDSVAVAYANLPAGSGMRKLLADWYAWDIRPGWFGGGDHLAHTPLSVSEFAVDVVVAMTRFGYGEDKGRSPFEGDRERYYRDTN